MRIAIAVLTLFAVQIFFYIYKFNQQQSSFLFAKAETMELFKDSTANQKDLRDVLLTKMDSVPKFEKGPTSPAEQIINIMEKSSDKK